MNVSDSHEPAGGGRSPDIRDDAPQVPWLLISILLAATTINYLDRLTASVLAPTLRDEFGLSNADYSFIVNAFTAGYLIFYSVGGRIADVIGARRALALFMVWWSIAGAAQVFTVGKWSLAAVRFVLAMGQGGAWPAAMKAAAERVPGPLRSLAVGITNSGSSIGAMLAPPLIGALAVWWGWQVACVAVGAIGFLWLPVWFRVTAAESRVPGASRREETVPWGRVVVYRQAWAVFLGRAIGDPFWVFYIFWLPEYLARDRGLDLESIAAVAWIPFMVAGVANMAGGGVTSWLVGRGWSVHCARRTMMWLSAPASMVGVVAAYTDSLAVAITAISLATFFFMFWSVNTVNLPSDWFPPKYVGTVFGFSGTGQGLGSMLIIYLVGQVLDATGNYALVFAGVGLLVPLAQLVMTVVGGPIRRLEIDE